MPRHAAASSNRANQLNPNHAAYWQSRGYEGRPSSWQAEVTGNQRAGAYEHSTNLAATISKQQKAERGHVTQTVETVTRHHFGGNAHVLHAGSQKKHTDIASTRDLDLMVSSRPWTASDKLHVTSELQKQFGRDAVHESRYRIKVQTKAGSVDVVPQRAEFLPSQRNAPPTDRFHANPKGQQAVRGIKMRAQAEGLHLKGDHIERKVLKAQQEHPHLRNFELEGFVFDQLM